MSRLTREWVRCWVECHHRKGRCRRDDCPTRTRRSPRRRRRKKSLVWRPSSCPEGPRPLQPQERPRVEEGTSSGRGWWARAREWRGDRVRPRLTPVVNFSNILWAAFEQIFFQQQVTKPNCNWRKTAQNTYVQKSCSLKLVKLTPACLMSHRSHLSQ